MDNNNQIVMGLHYPRKLNAVSADGVFVSQLHLATLLCSVSIRSHKKKPVKNFYLFNQYSISKHKQREIIMHKA